MNPVLAYRTLAGAAAPSAPASPAAALPFPASGTAGALPTGSPAPGLAPPVAVLERRFSPAPPAPSSPVGPAPAHAGVSPSPFPAALRDVEAARARIDGLLAEARRGRSFSPQELLCLQADAHRFAQSVELAARVVEHGVQGVRQALQAQV